MRKLPQTGRLADILHKSFVLTCAGVTLFGISFVGERTYTYFTKTKPARLLEQKQLEAKEIEVNETEVQDIAETLKV